MKKKKSQTEIMGLAIIVILLALAMLFVVQVVIMKKPSELKKSFTQKEIAVNTVTAMIAATTGCKELPLKTLLKDCAEGEFIDCDGKGSCSYSVEEINNIFEKTIIKWNKDYFLNISVEGEEGNPILIKGNIMKSGKAEQCPGEKVSSLSVSCCHIPTSAGRLTIALDICN